MNEEEYFDEIRRLKKRRKSEDDARRIIDAEKESFGGMAQEEYITSLRFQLAKDLGNAAWKLPTSLILKIAQTSFAGLAGLDKLIKTGSGEEATRAIEHEQSYDLPGAVGLSGPELDRSLGAVATGGEYIDRPFNWLGKKAADVTGSPAVGTAVYTGTQFAGPGVVKGLFNLGTGFGKTFGMHVLIDQRPQTKDIISGAVSGVARMIPGMTKRKGYYGDHPLDQPLQFVESGIRSIASATEAVFNPRAAAILRQHGLSPTAVRRIQAYRKELDKKDLAPLNREHYEKVLVAELEKAYAMKLKAGEAASPELSAILVDYYPRKMEVFGIPKPKELQTVLQGDIPLHELRYLIEDMAKTMDLGGRNNIYALGGNPGKSSMSGTTHNKILSENPAELFTGPRTAYEMVGDIWVNIAKGKRFDPKTNSWHSKPTPGKKYRYVYNELDPMEFNANTVKLIMDTKAKFKRKEITKEAAKEHPILSRFGFKGTKRVQSESTNVREVKIKGKDYILYHVVSGSDNPMLASTPAAILLNPRTGTSRILAFDELDLLSGKTRKIFDTGYPNGFVTVNSGSFTYPDHILKQVGIKRKVKEEPIVTTKAPEIDQKITDMLNVSAAPELAQTGIIPAITDKKRKYGLGGRFENR